MKKNPPLVVAGIIFVVVALLHLLRVIYQFNIIVNTIIIPQWISWVGFIIFFILAIWMFRASRNE